MAINKMTYQNLIDIGIFILFIDICLSHNKLKHKIEIYDDFETNNNELTLVGKITINN